MKRLQHDEVLLFIWPSHLANCDPAAISPRSGAEKLGVRNDPFLTAAATAQPFLGVDATVVRPLANRELRLAKLDRQLRRAVPFTDRLLGQEAPQCLLDYIQAAQKVI